MTTPLPVLRIEPLGVTVEVRTGRSLLEAARDAGIELRSACRNGTCRECLARVIEGRVDYRIEWPGVSADERAEGWVLPCVALPRGDVVLLQPRAERAP